MADRRLGWLCGAVVAFSSLQVATYGYGRDQGIYALVARTILKGGMPYRDVFDFKPPGIYLIYALSRAILGPAPWAIRALEVGTMLATAAMLVSLARRFWGERGIGWIAAALAALVHAQLDFWHTAQPETFGGTLVVLAVWIATPEPTLIPAPARVIPAWRHLAAGAAFGAAGLLKPPLAGGGAVLAGYELWRLRRAGRSWRKSLAPASWIAAGGLLPIAGCLSWIAAKGALPAMRDALFEFAPHYTALGWRGRGFVGLCYQALAEWLVSYCSLVTVGLLIGLANWRAAYARPKAPLLAGIVAVQLLGVALQGKFFPYHFAGVWPFTALLCALGWWHAWRWAKARGSPATAAFLSFVVFSGSLRTAAKDVPDSWWLRAARRVRLLAGGWRDRAAIDALASVADVNAAANRELAALLRARVACGQSAFIWGFEPGVYDAAGVPFASRYIYNVPQRVPWAAFASRAELMRDLACSKPAAIAVASGDVFPMVTGNAIGSAEVLEKDFPALRAFIAARYRKVAQIEDFALYERVER